MKQLTFLFLLSICLTACGNNSPKGITGKFLDALVAKDYAQAAKYCTPRGATVVNMMGSMDDGKTKILGYNILRDSVQEDRAWVYYETSDASGKTKATLELAKIDGKWKVDPTMHK